MKFIRLMLKTIGILIAIGLLIYAGLVAMVVWKEKHVPPMEDYEAIIVLGAQVRPNGEPSVQLAWRLDASIEAWKKHHCVIVVCGAQGSDEPCTEASAMKAYLVARGIPESEILMDGSSFNTRQNIANAAKALEGRAIRKVLVVTSDFHLPRSIALAEDAGFEASGLGSRTLTGWYWIKNHCREALAWCKYWVEKYTPFILDRYDF